MKEKSEDKIFEYKNRKFKFKVGFDEESKLLKLTMINIDTKEEKAINVSGVIPQGATPDCILINDTIGKDLINELVKSEILTEHTGIYARVNFNNMYKYDPKGVKEFLDYHTHEVEYENEGKDVNEVKKDIRRYTEELLKRDDIKEYLEDYVFDSNTEKYFFMYSLLDKKNPQSSVIVYGDENGEYYFLISPYEKRLDDKFEIVPEWQFTYYGGMMCLLDSSYEIIDMDEDIHYSIWQEVYDRFLEPKDEKYKKGVEKYMKYCKKNKITKERIMKNFNLEKFEEDIMKFYKPKNKER